jgi:hypothetical protein
MNWPGGQRDATVDNRPSWMKTLPPAPVSPAKTIKRPNPSRFQAPAPAPVVAPPVPVAAPVAAPSVPLAARAPPANHYGPAPLQPPPAAIGYRTRLCKHWLASGGTYCAYGAHCDFAHGEDQLLRHYAPHPPPYMQHGQPPAPPRGRSRSRGRRRGGHSRRRRSPSSSRSRSSSSSSSSSSSGRRRSRSRSPRRNRYDTALPRQQGQPPTRARDPSPAPGLGPRPKRRHLVAAAEAAPAPAEDDFDELYSEVAAPAPAADAEEDEFAVKLGMRTAPAPVPAAAPVATDDDWGSASFGMAPAPAPAPANASEADEDDDSFTVKLGMKRPAEPSSPDDESEPSPAAPPAAPAPAPAAAEAAPPAWEQSARELLAAVRGKGLLEIRSALTKHKFKCGPRVHGSSYFCFEAPGHYPCVYDIIGERYKDSKTATAKSSMRMRSHPQLIMYLEGALARGASVRLESAWDWAAHTGSRSRSRSPAQLEPTTAPSSPPRTPPPKRAQTAVPATVYDWCAARGWAPNSPRYRDIVMCCDDLDALANFWEHPDREEVLADWSTLARSICRREIKALQTALAK